MFNFLLNACIIYVGGKSASRVSIISLRYSPLARSRIPGFNEKHDPLTFSLRLFYLQGAKTVKKPYEAVGEVINGDSGRRFDENVEMTDTQQSLKRGKQHLKQEEEKENRRTEG